MPSLVNYRTPQIGSQIWFVKEGVQIGQNIVSADWKPPVAAAQDPPQPDPNWQRIGAIETMNINVNIQTQDAFAPDPGVYVPYSEIVTSRVTTLGLTLLDLNEFTYVELLLGGVVDPATGSFVPNKNPGALKGWFKVQQYKQDNGAFVFFDFWGSATPQPYNAARDNFSIQTNLKILQSPLNSGLSKLQPIVNGQTQP